MLLGIDSGQTTLKVIVIDHDGLVLGSSSRPTQARTPAPHQVERDMHELMTQCDLVIGEALSAAAVVGSAIDGVGMVAHGDGLYLVGSDGQPVRPAVLAVDTRAEGILDRWRSDGTLEAAVALTGQEPFAGSLAPICAWLKQHEPAAFNDARWLLSCKDWLRFGLTGEIATDIVEANSCVGSLDGRSYSAEALAVYGLESIEHKLPPICTPTDTAGVISDDAASRTGLRAGTPVMIGTHDVVAAALGSGATEPGSFCAVAGTYSVNQLITNHRVVDPRWQARPWLDAASWIYMAASPSSVTNFEWFLRTLMGEVRDPIAVANDEVKMVADEPSSLQFHPFLYGSPYPGRSSGSLLGLQGWHTRGHLIRAIFEGVVFNHRYHLDALSEQSPRELIRLTGGASRSAIWTQLFADILDCSIDVSAVGETGALGAAMLAGVGTGTYSRLSDATDRCVRVARTHAPDPARRHRWDEAYERYLASVEAIRPLWAVFDPPEIEKS